MLFLCPPPLPPPEAIDWSEFVPNLLIALLTGILFAGGAAWVVGRALVQWQRRRDAANRQISSRAEWRHARARLATTMRFRFQRSDMAHDLTYNAIPFAKVVQTTLGMDLVQWSLDDPENVELAVASRLVENAITIDRLALELQSLITIRFRAVQEHEPDNPEIQTLSYLVLEVPVPPNLALYEPRCLPVMEDPEFARQTAAYRLWLTQCEADYNVLWTALRAGDAAPRSG